MTSSDDSCQTTPPQGISDEERALLQEWNGAWEARKRYPEGTAMRAQLDRRLASLEVRLGL